MSYWKIIPEELIDWIEEKTSNPERYHRLVNYLIRIVNWGDGTYSDGVKVKRGEKRISINELAKKLKYSYGSTWEMLKNLEKAGWISIFSHYKLTIISLNWLKHCDTRTDNRFSENPITEPENSDNKPDNKSDNSKTGATSSKANLPDNKPDNTSDSKISKSRYQNQAQADIRNNTNNIEIIRTKKQNEDKHTENNSAPPQNSGSGSDSEEGKKIDRGIVERVVEDIVREFKLSYKRKFNRYPIIDRKSKQRVIDTLFESTETQEELQDLVQTLISKIPDFFSLTDPWVRKQGYSFFAFSFRISDLLAPKTTNIIPNTEEYKSDWVTI